MNVHTWGQPVFEPTSTNWRGTLNRSAEQYGLAPTQHEEPAVDGDDSDFREGLKTHPPKQRLMALERCIYPACAAIEHEQDADKAHAGPA